MQLFTVGTKRGVIEVGIMSLLQMYKVNFLFLDEGFNELPGMCIKQV